MQRVIFPNSLRHNLSGKMEAAASDARLSSMSSTILSLAQPPAHHRDFGDSRLEHRHDDQRIRVPNRDSG